MRCSLELGGNAPFIVFGDANLDRAVEGAMTAKVRNVGEACTAANRILLHRSIADAFVERFVARLDALRLGPGLDPATDIGPLIDGAAVARVRSWIDGALTEGAEVLTARSPGTVDDFIAPTLLTSVPTTSRLWTEEIFAPVATTTVFDTDEEALALANDTSGGLVAYLYTSDLHRGLDFAERLRFGMIGLNRGLVSNVAAPFGGIAESGTGREGGREGVWGYLDIKYVAIDRPR